METIPNNAGPVTIEITVSLPVLCDVVGEPQPGSTLTWRYTAGDRLLALNAARNWPAKQTTEPLDLETFTSRAAYDASEALGVAVVAIGYYILKDGTVLQCQF